VCLGWYLILLLRREAEVTLAATLAALVYRQVWNPPDGDPGYKRVTPGAEAERPRVARAQRVNHLEKRVGGAVP
jgi:hypothetical protein